MASLTLGKDWFKVWAEDVCDRNWLSKDQYEWCQEYLSKIPTFRKVNTCEDTGWQTILRIEENKILNYGAVNIVKKHTLKMKFANDVDMVLFKLRWL